MHRRNSASLWEFRIPVWIAVYPCHRFNWVQVGSFRLNRSVLAQCLSVGWIHVCVHMYICVHLIRWTSSGWQDGQWRIETAKLRMNRWRFIESNSEKLGGIISESMEDRWWNSYMEKSRDSLVENRQGNSRNDHLLSCRALMRMTFYELLSNCFAKWKSIRFFSIIFRIYYNFVVLVERTFLVVEILDHLSSNSLNTNHRVSTEYSSAIRKSANNLQCMNFSLGPVC